eukprot:9902928-Alexandrium_andersonii.AAC.1
MHTHSDTHTHARTRTHTNTLLSTPAKPTPQAAIAAFGQTALRSITKQVPQTHVGCVCLPSRLQNRLEAGHLAKLAERRARVVPSERQCLAATPLIQFGGSEMGCVW